MEIAFAILALLVILGGCTIVFALLLMGVCAILNRLSAEIVPRPPILSALGISAFFIVCGTMVNLMISTFSMGGSFEPSDATASRELTDSLITVAVDTLLLAGLVSLKLPTSIGKGLLVALCCCGVAFLAGICGGVAFHFLSAALLRM